MIDSATVIPQKYLVQSLNYLKKQELQSWMQVKWTILPLFVIGVITYLFDGAFVPYLNPSILSVVIVMMIAITIHKTIAKMFAEADGFKSYKMKDGDIVPDFEEVTNFNWNKITPYLIVFHLMGFLAKYWVLVLGIQILIYYTENQ